MRVRIPTGILTRFNRLIWAKRGRFTQMSALFKEVSP